MNKYDNERLEKFDMYIDNLRYLGVPVGHYDIDTLHQWFEAYEYNVLTEIKMIH